LIALAEPQEPAATRQIEDLFVTEMRRRRHWLGLSQSELAERTEPLGARMYQQTIAKIEANMRPVKLAEAEVIAAALETNLRDMLFPPSFEGKIPTGDALTILDVKEHAEYLQGKQQVMRAEASSLMAVWKRASEELAAARERETRASANFHRHVANLKAIEDELQDVKKTVEGYRPGFLYRPRKRGMGFFTIKPDDGSDEGK
jgi:transcriptional regulator with XRE-family HTH domain